MNKIKQAELLARFVHEGQTRYNGEEYIEHCKRLVKIGIDKGESEDSIIVRWLHDTLEDGVLKGGLIYLIDAYFGHHVASLVFVLSHNKSEETYNEYIELVSEHPEALSIKWDDMRDNLTTSAPLKQLKKYKSGCNHLKSLCIEIPKDIVFTLNNLISLKSEKPIRR